ncbi:MULTISPECIES: hypothetical protein [unclassified Hydrogenophaga]|jgi:hypothetical protein|uniref:hypothetical protein n=1 Tax=unclassified Hydrogenophaga TaxID=2610897 RepID=UPI00132027ED|nr:MULTISPECIES: hypothetical protein [unclassified Hydrogenophaga]MDP3351995.1 hypothetical protein [Hydrogenophaga sp.]QHE78618.1 hypothetical protein F9Z45_20950 [Hydrogenophaga sp. PBL-H3]QHE83043.1 hypothetical protein F9Z44_20950 [Hydrogenophaga sp. PBL-H3]
MTFDITVLVALAPGLLAASMVLLVAVPLLYRTRTVQAVLESVVLVGRLQEITHELSWVGAGFAALVGYTEKDSFLYLVTVLWFALFAAISTALAYRVAALQKLETSAAQRLMQPVKKQRRRKTI